MERALHHRLSLALLIAVLMSLALATLLATGLALHATHPALAITILSLFAINTTVLSFSALVALAGLGRHECTPKVPGPSPGRCAALWFVCGEPAEPLVQRIVQFLHELDRTGQRGSCDVFVLSDTQDAATRAQEREAFASLGRRIVYRNRAMPTDRKPGNLADWMDRWGQDYETMLVLDADSGFSAARLAQMRERMAAEPRLALLQAAIRMRPMPSRFGTMQRLSARLSGKVFAQGLAWLSGNSGNFWGHNALIRIRAFAEVAPLPHLSGQPPFGGPVLSHDFIEAAYLRRAGWHVAICPDSRGSFEDTPLTIAAHLRRDRRWAQGNLQHLRLIGSPGLHPASRLHLASGILSYLAAPIWLLLVLLTGSGAVHATPGVIWPLLGVLLLLLVPKLAGLASRHAAMRRPARRRVMLRAVCAELGLTTLFAPLGMLRRSGFVVQIATGRSVAWVPSGQALSQNLRHGRHEVLGGIAITVAVALPQWLIAGPAPAVLAALLVLPVTLPLLAAPYLWGWFDKPAPVTNSVEQYYDASTRRFLALGRSGTALAIHRPLWGDGVTSHTEAASHVNTLIAAQAEAALGRPPERVVDLGCGVGGTLFHLARRWPDTAMSGITISAEQVRLAQGFARAQSLETRCSFLRSDFTLPMTLPRADLVVAVESHVHARSAGEFLQAALRHLRPGGVLLLVDDMLAAPEETLTSAQARRVMQFRRGWQLGHVPDSAGLLAQAEAMGFTLAAMQDLTRYLYLDRLRDHALRLAGPVADRLGLAQVPFFGNMIGGNALTESYRSGQMRYTLMALRSSQQTRATVPATHAEAVA